MSIKSVHLALGMYLVCGASAVLAQPGRYWAEPDDNTGVPYQAGANNTLREVTGINDAGVMSLWQIKASYTVGMTIFYIQGAYSWDVPNGLVLLSNNYTTQDNAYDINDNDLGAGSANNGTYIQAAYLDAATAPSFISTFGSASTAWALNNDGDAVGQYVYSTGPTVLHGFLKESGSSTADIGSLGGGYTIARDINNDDFIVGTSDDGNDLKAFILEIGGSMVDINDLFESPECYFTDALAISQSGLVAVVDTCGDSWVLDPDNTEYLVQLDPISGSHTPHVLSVNSSGIAVGYQSTGSFPSTVLTACKWETDGTAVNLYDHTVNQPAAVFTRAMDVNDHGQIAVFCVAGGNNRIYRLTPLCNADLNSDGFVDGIDEDIFNNAFEEEEPLADLNGDTFFDGIDIDIFNNWVTYQTGCP